MNPNTGKRRLNHWVEELFPVTYSCTDEEDILSSCEVSTSLTVVERAQVRAQARAVRVKDIYGSVLREQAESARKARLERIASIIVREHPEVSECDPTQRHAAEAPCDGEKGAGGAAGAAGAAGAVVENLVTQARCLWSEEDLAILRRCTEEKDAEIRKLKCALTVAQEDRDELRSRCDRLQKDLVESQTTDLAARQEAERRAMHCRQLECQAETERKSLESLQEVVSAVQSQASRCRRDLHAARLQEQRARERKQDMKLQLQNASREYLLKEAELQGKMEQRHKCALEQVEGELRQVREELAREQQAHRRDLASLELLRRHFLNLQVPRVESCMKISHW